jgi:hypothetical protein
VIIPAAITGGYMPEDHRAYIDKQITELRTMLLGQIRELHDLIASLRQELREVRMRNEKLESHNRRL